MRYGKAKARAVTAVALMSALAAVVYGAASSPLDFTVKDIRGEDIDLSKYKGKVVLIVNTASKCGLTPQYEGLQALYETYGGRGLVVLGFPANDFMGQEPGTDEEIQQFCSVNYGVTFPMFSKISVKGRDMAPLYRFLTSEKTNPGFGGDIEWNFAKFLIGRDGRVVMRFHPKVAPGSDEVITAIENELEKGKK